MGEEERSVVPRNAPAYLGLTRAEMSWAAAAHASILLTLLLGLVTGGLGALLGLLIPALIWVTQRGKSGYVADQARQATLFQLAGLVALLALILAGAILLVVGWIAAALLSLLIVGLILLPIMLVLTIAWVIVLVAGPIAWVVWGCYGAAEASNGRPFRYRYVSDLFDARNP